MVEIFTVGGGEYIVNVLNAVAAWTGAGGYKSLLQVALVMGHGARGHRGRVQSGLARLDQLVPRRDAHLHVPDGAAHGRPCDRPGQSKPSLPANGGQCAAGLALMASFTSQAGDYLTGSAEVVFGLPDDLNYSKNGMIYGARLLRCDALLAHFRSGVCCELRRAFPAMRVLRSAARPLLDEGAVRER